MRGIKPFLSSAAACLVSVAHAATKCGTKSVPKSLLFYETRNEEFEADDTTFQNWHNKVVAEQEGIPSLLGADVVCHPMASLTHFLAFLEHTMS